MTVAMNLLRTFLQDEAGATAIEYGLIAAILSFGVLVGLRAYGTDIADLYNDIYVLVAGTF